MFIWLFLVLVAAHRIFIATCGIFSSPTRDQTWAPCSGSTESQPLDHQQSPFLSLFQEILLKIEFYLFISGRAGSLLLCADFLSLWPWGFSLQWPLLWSVSSRHSSFSRCGLWTQLSHGMWDLPEPGIELLSPALASGFLTTETPGKSRSIISP